jgi:hypothetical protein
MVEKQNPVRFKHLMELAERQAAQRIAVYKQIAAIIVPDIGEPET